MRWTVSLYVDAVVVSVSFSSFSFLLFLFFFFQIAIDDLSGGGTCLVTIEVRFIDTFANCSFRLDIFFISITTLLHRSYIRVNKTIDKLRLSLVIVDIRKRR